MSKLAKTNNSESAAIFGDQQEVQSTREVIELLDPNTILLDKSNPRISPILLADGLTNPTQQQIAAAIVKSREWRSGRGGFTTPFNDFLNAVIKDGRINEPPVVQRQRDGKTVVLHGNNRVLAAQRAKKQVPGEGFDLIRCRVLPPDTPEAEIQKYMRIAHNPTTKQADWHPAVHAHLLYQFANADIGGIGTMTSRELQEEFTKGPKTIKDMVQAYGAMQQYMTETGDRRPLALWATFHELYRNKGVAELYTDDDDFRDAVHESMQQKKLNAEDVKILPKIKEDDDAWKEFTEGAGSATAKMMVEGDIESDNHFDRIRKLSRIITDVSSGPSVKGIKRNPAQKKIVTDLIAAVRTLLEKANMEGLLEAETV
jgi:hypothetical protein